VLIAEDDEAARVLLARYLEKHGYKVTQVSDGKQALQTLSEPNDFDLVILDVMMPHHTGFEVLEKVRAAGSTVPIVMATAATNPEDVVKALQLGADDYVNKPYSFQELQARMEARMRARPSAPAPPPPPARREPTGAGFLERLKRRFKHAPPPEPAPGSRVAERYVIETVLGRGAFGTVFRARHLDLAQPVALKILRAAKDASAVAAFRREAQIACRVRHPNAVQVYDFGLLPPDGAFLVMELLEGPTLFEVQKTRPLIGLEDALGHTRAVLSALAAAHKQGLIHRDVKPANVVLHQDQAGRVPKLVDFGLARDEDEWDDDEGLAGSPAYLSPERIRGEEYDGRADVYSCGIMLYKLLTGSLPIDGDPTDIDKVVKWHLEVSPLKPSTMNPHLSPAVDQVVLKLVAKNPVERPQADEAASLVENLLWD